MCINLPNFVTIGQSISELLRFLTLKNMAAVRQLAFLRIKSLMVIWVKRAMCAIETTFDPIGPVAAILRFFYYSKWRPSTILDLLYACLDYTHEEYLVVFVTLLNLFGIGALVSIICKF